jgi:hypothetical protein
MGETGTVSQTALALQTTHLLHSILHFIFLAAGLTIAY